MKLKKLLLPLLNPSRWYKAYRFKQSQPPYSKANRDLELQLYGKMLKYDMLHYGYFDDPDIDPETISIRDVENAQKRYAEVIGERVSDKDRPILDVGCGMGGLSSILHSAGYTIEALTPDVNQKKHIAAKYPDITCFHTRFEDFKGSHKYGTVINSESLQYIDLDTAFQQVDALLEAGGKWIITDYFRLVTSGKSKSGHTMEVFKEAISKKGWKIDEEVDITPNCLPTLRLINVYIERFVLPGAAFGVEKMKVKQPMLYHVTGNIREAIAAKAEKEFASVDPKKFAAEKKYMLYVLSRA